MNAVTNITLHVDLGFDESECMEAISKWLTEHEFGPLDKLDVSFVGKIRLYGGSYNSFPEDEFATFVMQPETRI